MKFKEWLKSNHFPAEELTHVGLLIDGLCKQLGTRLMVSLFLFIFLFFFFFSFVIYKNLNLLNDY